MSPFPFLTSIISKFSSAYQAQRPAAFFKGREDPVQLLLGMGGHIACPYQSLAFRHSRTYRNIRKYTFFLEHHGHFEGCLIIADEDRDNRRLAGPHLEPEVFEALKHFLVFFQSLSIL